MVSLSIFLCLIKILNFIDHPGKVSNVTEVPWHVGIYKNDTQICGGTIISERVVISAAHCFTQNTNNFHEIDYKSYQVAAGKLNRDFDVMDYPKSQIRDIEEVGISER